MRSLPILLLLTIIMTFVLFAHGQEAESSKNFPGTGQEDTNRVNKLLELAESYFFTKPDSCLFYSNQAIRLAQNIHFTKGELEALNEAGVALRILGDFPQALEMQFKALQINIKDRDKEGEATTKRMIGISYIELNEYRQALDWLFLANKINDSLSQKDMSGICLSSIGDAYEKMNMLDSALNFQLQARAISIELGMRNLKSSSLEKIGIVLTRSGRYNEALRNFHDALYQTKLSRNEIQPSDIQYQIGELYLSQMKNDSSLYYARLAYKNGRKQSQKFQVLEASNLLVKIFRLTGTLDSVIHYQDIAAAMKDSLFGRDKLRQFQLFSLKEQQRQQEIIQEQVRYKNQSKTIALLLILGFFLLIASILFRNNRLKQKVNSQLLEQKNEIQDTLAKLKSTQTRLIQSEKMASLGELTAGIAHEIQNPLNFVNNFSELNTELIEEMKAEMDKGNLGEAKIKSNEISDNAQKILHHGKRADAIVKSMLQHSQSISGGKEFTDMNTMINEYLLLALKGFRKNYNSFNATIKTNLDESIGKIKLIPQDIGRVLLNIYNNAFYAMATKMKQQKTGYEPTITVTTKMKGGQMEVEINDNGEGIPKQLIDKIFQPFFTTKPTGQGTGLGLSLAYDIVKAHGGEIEVNTEEGEYTNFIVRIPV
jgi:two-component system, NtrC family, sensor kinase